MRQHMKEVEKMIEDTDVESGESEWWKWTLSRYKRRKVRILRSVKNQKGLLDLEIWKSFMSFVRTVWVEWWSGVQVAVKWVNGKWSECWVTEEFVIIFSGERVLSTLSRAEEVGNILCRRFLMESSRGGDGRSWMESWIQVKEMTWNRSSEAIMSYHLIFIINYMCF